MYRILIVEDDEIIEKSIEDHMKSWGYEVEVANDFKNVMEIFVTYKPQLVLLDISLPFYNGYHWCNEIRKVSQVPIIIISSSSDNMNIVMAMNMGADDFISKPFDLNVLTAKVQAIIRRTYNFSNQTNLIEHNKAILNLDEKTFTYEDKVIELTKNEYKILKIMLENRKKVVKRDDLMIYLWETDSFVDENTLTVNVTRLRKKLEAAGLTNFITTKKGIGYMIK